MKISNFKLKITSSFFQQLFLYLIILFLPTQFGKHFWPSFSSVLGIRIDYLSPTVYTTDILIVFLFISFFFSSLKRFKTKFKIANFKKQIKKNILNFKCKFTIYYLLFTVIMIAGVFLSKNPPLGAYGLLKFFEFFFFGFYVFSHLKKGKDLGFIVLLFSIGILGESFLAIFQFLKQGSLNSLFYYFGERTFTSYTPGIANVSLNGRLFLRPYGTFPHPNVIAAYLLIGLTLIIFNLKFLILNQFLSFNFKRIIFLLALFIGTIALFLTMSRVAIILWLIIFSFFLFRAIKAKSYFKFIFAIYFLLFAIFSLSPIRYRFSEVNIKDESVLKRQETIIQSVEVFKKNPIFGTGVNNYLINVKPLFYNNTIYIQPVHNIYLLILAQTGIVGLLFFVWFICRTLKQATVQVKNKSMIHNSPASLREAGRAKFIILVTVLVLGLFDHYFLTLQQGQLLFSLVLGIVWSRIEVRGQK